MTVLVNGDHHADVDQNYLYGQGDVCEGDQDDHAADGSGRMAFLMISPGPGFLGRLVGGKGWATPGLVSTRALI